MSNFPPGGGANKNPAFVDALQRARQIASKIKPNESGVGGVKRPNEDNEEGPGSKKPAESFGMEGNGGSSGPGNNVGMESNNAGGNGVTGGSVPSAGGPGGGGMTETIMVPDKMVGLIIGRGGEQITRLQAETGCKIQMAPDAQGLPDRQCTLTGTPQAITGAKMAIDRIIANEGSGGGPPRGPTGMGGAGFYEINVPGPKVGLIIGKSGETIKNLQEQSGAKIVIIQDGPEAAVEKPLRITGAPENVEIAKQLVAEILNQDHDRDMGGFGSRGRGRGRGRGGFGLRGGRGGRGGGGYGGGQWGPGGGGGMSGGGVNEYGGQHTDYISIPSNKCGLVIGKGGETIKNINQTTGAHCEVDKNAPPDAREKNFVIRGTPDAVERAKQMILEKVGMNNLGNGGNNSGGGYNNGYNQGGWGGASSGYQQQQSGYQEHGNPQQPGQDYSSQWAEYYRSMGMIREAEAIEKHIGATANSRVSNGMPTANPAVPAANGAAPAVAGGSGGADYSVQWAEYYRSVGKIKEAEAIELQLKNKAAAAAAAAAAAPAGGQAYPAQYAGYYGGGQQPGYAPPAAAGYPGYAPYGGAQHGAES